MLLETPNGVDLIQIIYFWFCNAWYDVCSRYAFLIIFCCIIKSAYMSLNIHLLQRKNGVSEVCWAGGELLQYKYTRQAPEKKELTEQSQALITF